MEPQAKGSTELALRHMTMRSMLCSFCRFAAAVKDAVVDAIDELYLANCDAEAAAHNLVGLAQGSNLGALHSSAEVVHCMASGRWIVLVFTLAVQRASVITQWQARHKSLSL